ncbi:MAG: hypothetical protein LUE27_05240 [Clostridia bacterium]|nr:hypothetical protein [Clostridia bacterium]
MPVVMVPTECVTFSYERPNGKILKFRYSHFLRGGGKELKRVCPDINAQFVACSIAADFYKVLIWWKRELLPVCYKKYKDSTGGDPDDFCDEVKRGMRAILKYTTDDYRDARAQAFEDAVTALQRWREQYDTPQTNEIVPSGEQTVQTVNCTPTANDCDSGKRNKERRQDRREQVIKVIQPFIDRAIEEKLIKPGGGDCPYIWTAGNVDLAYFIREVIAPAKAPYSILEPLFGVTLLSQSWSNHKESYKYKDGRLSEMQRRIDKLINYVNG